MELLHRCGDSGGLVAYYVAALILSLFALTAQAASYQSAQTYTLKKGTSGTYTYQGAGIFSGGGFNFQSTINLAGQQIAVPSRAQLAVAARTTARVVIRANVALWALSSVQSWLASQGITCAVETGCQAAAPGAWTVTVIGGGEGPLVGEPSAHCAARGSNYVLDGPYIINNGADEEYYCRYGVGGNLSVVYRRALGVLRPSNDSDWAKLDGSPLTDGVANAIAPNTALPVDPSTQSTPWTPLGPQYQNPTTGKNQQDFAKADPAPAPNDPLRVVVTVKTDVPAQGADPAETKPGEVPEDAFCEKFPNASACQELGEADDLEIENQDKPVNIAPDSGWGPSTGTCPAPVSVHTPLGGSVMWSYEPACTFLLGIRPVVLAAAWLAAALIFLGAFKE